MKSNQSKLRRWVRYLAQRGHQFWLTVQIWLWDSLLSAVTHLEAACAPMRRTVAAGDLTRLRQDLLEESQLSWHYLVLVVGSCVIATLGLLSNSAAVIIGAMIIAPLMLPIRGAAFGILEADRVLIRTSIGSLAVGSLLAVSIAALIGSLTGIAQFGSEVMARTQPTLLDLGIAVSRGAGGDSQDRDQGGGHGGGYCDRRCPDAPDLRHRSVARSGQFKPQPGGHAALYDQPVWHYPGLYGWI